MIGLYSRRLNKVKAVIIFVVISLNSLFLVSCSQKVIRPYNGPEVTRVEVFKSERVLLVYHKDKVLKKYPIDLGFGPKGPKQFEGDGKTPEGKYFINKHNPNSAFYLSLGISYPNKENIDFAKSLGKSPGGDIFIHGSPNSGKKQGPDWTAGCIAVKNRHMKQLYRMIKTNTKIYIFP